MRAFAELFAALDRTPRTAEKVAALTEYFRATPPADAAWALWFLSGQRLKRAVKTRHLREWVAAEAGLPLWLVEESYDHVGDLAETLALLLPPNPAPAPPALAELVRDFLLPLADAPESRQRELLRAAWARLDTPQRFLWHKLITGGFRVGVSRALLVRALAALAGVEPSVMLHRLQGHWQPTAEGFAGVLAGVATADAPARPYPFFLASPLEGGPTELGDATDWLVEWKWDGIRAQLLRRAGQTVVWSRGEEMVTESFPEIAAAARALPDGTVLDGELLAWRGEGPLPFAELQRRLNRRAPNAALRAAVPVVFMAYDILEAEGTDLRARPLADRREVLARVLETARLQPGYFTPRTKSRPGGAAVCGRLETFYREKPVTHRRAGPRSVEFPGQGSATARAEAAPVQAELFGDEGVHSLPAEFPLRFSPALSAANWTDVAAWREQARAAGAEGLMLKRRDSAYGAGRQRGAWWKWKVTPFTCDAVLVSAQSGHGRRATLFTDYTFAVWRGAELVPVARAYSGLTDAEIDAVDRFVRANTTGRHGPVRTVKPELVFELAFEGIAASPRHQAGLALRFPRIARWRHDKPASEADKLETLQRLAGTTRGA